MTIFSSTKLFLMLRRIQHHILLSIRSCVLANQINVSESKDQSKSGEKYYTIEPATPGNACTCSIHNRFSVAGSRSLLISHRILGLETSRSREELGRKLGGRDRIRKPALWCVMEGIHGLPFLRRYCFFVIQTMNFVVVNLHKTISS